MMIRFIGRLLMRLVYRILFLIVLIAIAVFVFRNYFGGGSENQYTVNTHTVDSSESEESRAISELDLAGDGEKYVGIINCHRLNVRKGPGTDHPIIGVQVEDDMSVVQGREGEWYHIYLEGAEYTGYGWVHSSLLDVFGYDENSQELFEVTFEQ